MTIRGLGWKPDRTKRGFAVHREPRLSMQRPAALPRGIDFRDLGSPGIDQFDIPLCVSNQVMLAHRGMLRREGVEREFGSRRHNYHHACAYTPEIGFESGTWLHSGVNAAIDFGVPPESAWPYPVQEESVELKMAQVERKPSFSAEHAAFDWSGPEGYERIDDGSIEGDGLIEALMTALSERHPVIFGTLVSARFCRSDLTEVQDVPDPDEEIAGGHALSVWGYTTLANGDRLFLVNTSWGLLIGELGFFWMTESYMRWQHTNDLQILKQRR